MRRAVALLVGTAATAFLGWLDVTRLSGQYYRSLHGEIVLLLDADLEAAFDRLSHDHILRSLGTFPARGLVRRWLRAGVMEDGKVTLTREGVPQGGVISPVIMNVALHGMEEAAVIRPIGALKRPDSRGVSAT